MSGVIKNELIKIFLKKKIYIFMAIIFIMTILPAFIFRFAETDIDMTGQMFPVENMTMNLGMLIPIFLSILISDMITEEYINGTLKIPLIHPVSRKKLFNGKLLALLIATTTLVLFSLIISYGSGYIFFEWGESLQINNVDYFGINSIFVTVGLYVSSLFPLLAFSTVIIFIALKLTSSGAVVGVSVGFIFALNILSQLVEKLRPFLIYTYFNPIVFLISPGGVDLLQGIIIIFIYGVIFYVLSLKMFEKQDLLF